MDKQSGERRYSGGGGLKEKLARNYREIRVKRWSQVGWWRCRWIAVGRG